MRVRSAGASRRTGTWSPTWPSSWRASRRRSRSCATPRRPGPPRSRRRRASPRAPRGARANWKPAPSPPEKAGVAELPRPARGAAPMRRPVGGPSTSDAPQSGGGHGPRAGALVIARGGRANVGNRSVREDRAPPVGGTVEAERRNIARVEAEEDAELTEHGGGRQRRPRALRRGGGAGGDHVHRRTRGERELERDAVLHRLTGGGRVAAHGEVAGQSLPARQRSGKRTGGTHCSDCPRRARRTDHPELRQVDRL